MSKDRVARIDTDIEHVGRQKVIDYITKKYGAESVCRIVTFGTMAAKMVIKDVARVMGFPAGWANTLAKLIPEEPKMTLNKAFDMNPELRRRYDSDPDVAKVIDVAKTLEGCKRHASQHACFEAGTPILTSRGKVPIEKVCKGDMVMTHKGRLQRVVDTMVTYTETVYDICVAGRTITVTGNHPLMTGLNQWVPVASLNENADCIVCRVGGCFRSFPFKKTMRKVPEQAVYNLTVENDSSYIANGVVAHNCGLVVAPGKVQNFLPTSMEKDSSGEKSLTSQVVMTEVEALSLLKMDLLGLKNLSAIHEVMDNVKRTRGIKMKYQDLPLDDRDTYKMLAKGLTGGVFQLESAGMTDVIRQMLGDIDTLPNERMGECFERLIAAVALYRPGPMDYIPDYIRGMMDKNSIHYDCKQEEDILASTYGVMVYQEQLMHIAQALAGYSLGEADLLRKACGKKKKDVMAKERNRFIHGNKDEFDSGKAKHLIPGCIGNGIAPEVAEEIWNKMEKFASYAFNRSHAACYAWIASITAYMACHWPAEFFCAMLNAFEDISDKVKNYLSLAVRRGIKVLPPDINKSMDKCTVEGDCIRLGLHALSNLNKLSRAIVRVRKDGPFISYQDFYERMNDDGSVNKKALESLIYSGAMDSFGLNRRQMIAMTPMLEKNYKNKANVAARALDQICLFSKEELQILPPDVPEYDEKFLMNGEFQTTGFYLGNHPVDLLYSKLKDVSAYTPISDLVVAESPKRVTVTLGILSNLRCVYTKKEEEMYIFSASDRFSTISCVLFPSRVAANKHRLQDGAVVKLVGEFAVDEERGRQIIVQDILGEEEVLAVSENSVTVTIQNKEEQERLLTFVAAHPGSAAVKLMCNGKAYNLKGKFHMSPQTLDFLRNNFAKVTA